ncbi:MAG: C4-dicarboxylate ABC transporter permease [Deltaproteobacteria bacterium HGW-Deltaproteobacteria-19]|jgi:C4-dicarboxylate transporter DctM subunit|nr:MAG: C4-dicarboxylate ABC transporter permease [Deltaproteobacteria bacterium HGW-Deltaproteobacteria-19]
MGWLLFGSFFLFLLVGVPVGLAVGLSALIIFVVSGIPLQMVPQTFFEGSSSYALVAVPFFILAGDILARGGISERILAIAEATIGRIRGGLGIVATCTSMFIAAISGSGAATTAAVGASLLPEMNKKKYDTDFSAALIASSGTIGVVIPPSVPMVLYAVIAGESVAKLFMGGFIPGTMMGVGLITYAIWYSNRQGYPASEKLPARVVVQRLFNSLWGLMTPVIILGGIFAGYFTPSEAAAIAVDYTLLIAWLVYRSLTFKRFYELVVGAGVTSALIMFIIGTAKIFGWGLAFYEIPEAVAKSMLIIAGNNDFLIYLIMSVIILIAGFFMETASALIILTPIFLPLIAAIGGDTVHFGVIMTIGLAIGMATPPMAINIFVASAISGRSLEQISRAIWPMVIILIAVLLICTYFPWFVMVLPKIFMGVQ